MNHDLSNTLKIKHLSSMPSISKILHYYVSMFVKINYISMVLSWRKRYPIIDPLLVTIKVVSTTFRSCHWNWREAQSRTITPSWACGYKTIPSWNVQLVIFAFIHIQDKVILNSSFRYVQIRIVLLHLESQKTQDVVFWL